MRSDVARGATSVLSVSLDENLDEHRNLDRIGRAAVTRGRSHRRHATTRTSARPDAGA